VLQAVVGDDELHFGMGGEQGAGGFNAAAGNGGGRVSAAIKQQGFIACFGGAAVGG
jgi:hypothetical protein